jgi:hypothetical protein
VTEWLKLKTGDLVKEGSVKTEERCAFCWHGTPLGKTNHAASKCPVLASFNKVRAHSSLTPISLSLNSIAADGKKEPASSEKMVKDLQKEVKDLKAAVGGMEKRLAALELKPGLKRPADPSTQSPPPQPKRKKGKKKELTGSYKDGGAQRKASGRKGRE